MMKKLFLLALLALLPLSAHADSDQDYTFSNATLRETPAQVAAAYVTISNPTGRNDVLTGAKADWADHIEIHQVKTNDQGVVEMSQVKGILLPARGKIELKQGGDHLMVFGVKGDLKPDSKVNITLVFEHGSAKDVAFTVQPLGNAAQSAMKMDGMKMDNMKGM